MRDARALGARIAREATRVDRSAIEIGFAVRSTVGVAIAIGLSNVFHAPIEGAAAAVGTMVVGFASRQGVYRTRAIAMIVTALAMAVSAFAGSLSHENTVASIVVVLIFGYAYGIVSSLGNGATTIASNSAVALAIFGSFSLSPTQAAYQSLFVFAGGLLQTFLLVALWPFERFSNERSVLASAFRTLAAYARSFPSLRLRSPAAATFAKLSDVFADMQPFARRGEIAAFEVLFDEVERIRGAVAALATEKFLLERRKVRASTEAIAAAGLAAANVMSEIAAALAGARAPQGTTMWEPFEEPLVALASVEDTFSRRAHDDLQALVGSLRATWRAAYAPAGQTLPDVADPESPCRPSAPRAPASASPEFGETLRTLRANLSPRSEYSRHGVRLAVVLAVAVVAEHLLPLQRAYWIVLTAALVLRPDFGATFTRGIARICGTLAGAVLASLIALAHPGDITLGVLAVAFAFTSYCFIPINYGLFTLSITAYVVFVIGVGGGQAGATIVDRVVSTLGGGALALIAYAAWPTWERRLFPRRLAESLDALSRYGSAIFAAYLDPERANDLAIHRRQLGAWLARSNAEASFDRMSSEPVKPGALSVRAALGILAASRRYGLALLSLSVHRTGTRPAAEAELRALASGCTASLAIIGESLRMRRPPAPLPDLRRLHSAFVTVSATSADAELGVAAAETDLMVGALATIARILERRFAAVPLSDASGRRGRPEASAKPTS